MTDGADTRRWPTYFTVAIVVRTLVLLSRESVSTTLVVLLLVSSLVGLGVRVYDFYTLTQG